MDHASALQWARLAPYIQLCGGEDAERFVGACSSRRRLATSLAMPFIIERMARRLGIQKHGVSDIAKACLCIVMAAGALPGDFVQVVGWSEDRIEEHL